MAEAELHSKKPLFVAAIDLGTTYSGWAYSTLGEPDKVYTNQTWYSDCGTLGTLKTPSSVLLTQEKEFKSFGYDAETMFAEDEGHSGYYLFRRFKMALYDDRKLTRDVTIEDVSGKKMPALVIFAHSIEYLKDNFMETVRKRIPDVKDTDVSYVLTVPAIWNDIAKRFMREAALKAGIPDDQLTIALEPEAASIWCQGIHTEIHRNSEMANLGICAEGTRYMIVDLGGGTADITVHEKRPNNTLLEIHKPSGGPWGGTEVDKSFIRLLEEILGSFAWEKYKQMEVGDLLDIFRQFEMKKRNIKPDKRGYELIKLPSSLKETFDKYSQISELELVAKFHSTIEWKRDKLKVASELLSKCFEEPVSQVIAHIKDILSERDMTNVQKIMLVGGFAESKYVQKAFKEKFADKQIIIPPECGLAVLKGAVLFGQNPSVVTARIARYTYGVDIAVPFDRKKHSREKLVVSDVGPLCKDSFWKAVEIGQEIKSGYEVSRIGKAVDDYQSIIILKLFKTKQRDPKYTTDVDCEYIGQIEIPMDSTLKADENTVNEIFIFGQTELKLKTRHRTTGFENIHNFDL